MLSIICCLCIVCMSYACCLNYVDMGASNGSIGEAHSIYSEVDNERT